MTPKKTNSKPIRFHDVFFDLPAEMRAKSPTEVRTILYIDCQVYKTGRVIITTRGGSVVDRAPEIGHSCQVDLVDKANYKLRPDFLRSSPNKLVQDLREKWTRT